MDAAEFELVVGHKPEQDDLERANCPDAGKIGHACCGICPHCGVPRFLCIVAAHHGEVYRNMSRATEVRDVGRTT